MIDADAVAMITAEPTGGVVWHASRGAITLRVGVEGRPAHVGQAHLGVNAFEQMIADRRAALRPRARAARAPHRLSRWRARRRADRCSSSAARPGSGANFNVVPGRGVVLASTAASTPRKTSTRKSRACTTTIDEAAARIGAEVSIDVLQQQPSAGTERAASRRRRAGALRRGRRGRAGRASSSAPACWRRAGTRSSAFRPSPTAPGASTSPMAPTSTSTRPRCAAAPRCTPCSRATRSAEGGEARKPTPRVNPGGSGFSRARPRVRSSQH